MLNGNEVYSVAGGEERKFGTMSLSGGSEGSKRKALELF